MFLVSLTSLSPALSTAPPLFPPPTVCSTHSLSHLSRSPLRYGQITELGITEDYPAHRITNPAPGGQTQRALASASESAEHMPFRKNPEGLATITHLANATGKGFILWATLARIISLYSAQQQGFRIVKGQPPPAPLIY